MPSTSRSRKIDSSIKPPAGPEPDPPRDGGGLIGAAAACALLDIKPASLYAYVSRGLVRSVRTGGRKQRLYVEDDVRRLATRSAARRGHGAVAAGALRWGEPVLASAITSVEGGVLAYRGRRIDELIDEPSGRAAGFEATAELLWQATPAPWPAIATPAVGRVAHPVWRMIAALPVLASADGERGAARGPAELARARRVVTALAGAAGATPGRSPLAAAMAHAGGGRRDDDAVAAVGTALVACADHELNASTFAARIAAAAGADLYAALGAALCTFTGARHGGAPEHVEAVLARIPPRGVRAAVVEALRHGEQPPGFGHRLYPDGDPRARLILARLPRPRSAAAARRLAHARDVAARVTELSGEHPSLDFALCALARALGAGAAWASAVFALGRSAGWIAHVLEQREGGELLRPRARYTGPAPGPGPAAQPARRRR
jgi:citrate synthase